MSDTSSIPSVPKEVHRKKSQAWGCFADTPDVNKVKCKYCDRKCSIKGGSTGNLMRHLRLKHIAIFKAILKHERAVKEAYRASNAISKDEIKIPEGKVETILEFQDENGSETALKSSTAMEESSEQPAAYYVMAPAGYEKNINIDQQVLKLMVKELRPFNLTEDLDFISFVRMLNPQYTLPSYKYLSDGLLPQKYLCTVEKVRSSLKEAVAVALTIDRWISIKNENYISVSVNYLNSDFELERSLLDCSSFHNNRSTSVAIFFQELAAKWGLSEKITAVITDNDPIVLEAIKKCHWQHILCFAYTLNTVVQSGLLHIDDTLAKVRNIVGFFKRNPEIKIDLESLQNEMGLAAFKLKRDNAVGWNSTFNMITRFFKNKEIFTKLSEELTIPQLSPHDWAVLENAIKLLLTFNAITVEICSEENVFLSKVPHMVRFILRHVNDIIKEQEVPIEIKNMAQTLKDLLTEHYSDVEMNDIICQSVLLDPRLKQRGFPESSFEAAYSSLHKSVMDIKLQKLEAKCNTQAGNKSKQTEYVIDVWSEFRKNENLPEQNLSPYATIEIDTFLNETYLNMKDKPLAYWSNTVNQNKFPTLFELVKRRLCVPATSIPSKMIFSKAGNAFMENRIFLPSKKLKDILFLNQNW